MKTGGQVGAAPMTCIAMSLLLVAGCGASAPHATMASAPQQPTPTAESYANIPPMGGAPSAGDKAIAAEPAPEPAAVADSGAARRSVSRTAVAANNVGNAATPGSGQTTPAQPSGGQTAVAAKVKRPKNLMLVYTANLTLAVFEAVKGLNAVEDLAVEAGGYLVRRTDRNIVVRVPAEGFHDLLDRIGKIGDELHRDVSVRDVTAEFRDLETNLKNLVAVRDRLQQLLNKAKTVPEALQVERELTRVTGQIEQIKGRLKLLGELVAYSTISVTFQAQPAEKVKSTVELPFPWLRTLGLTRLLQL